MMTRAPRPKRLDRIEQEIEERAEIRALEIADEQTRSDRAVGRMFRESVNARGRVLIQEEIGEVNRLHRLCTIKSEAIH
jgi:hypothetical protein